MGSSQSSHAKYSSNANSSFNMKTQFRTSSVRGRKRSQFVESKFDSSPSGLDATSVSLQCDDVHHHEFDLSAQISSAILDYPIIENIADANYDSLPFTVDSLLEDADHDSISTTSSFSENELDDIDEELEEERSRILQESLQLKEYASYFLHPEASVPSSPGARCFFDRPSAPCQVSESEANEVSAILDDAKALKIAARDFLHPELTVAVTDPTIYGRNFYSRYEYVDEDSFVDAEARDQILQDVIELKKLAKDFLHPEASLTTTDSTLFGRNYFSRPGAPVSFDAEKESILEDLKGLKKLAVDYLHPEFPVVESDPYCRGRNYFSRYAAVEQESLSDAVYRSQVQEDMIRFKEVAVQYLHPEIQIVVSDPCLRARNYFGRFSAVEQESLSDSFVRNAVMKDLKTLKQFAMEYLHPEIPTISDSTSFARNFFTRSTAPSNELNEEREQILKDMQALKALAVDFLHPERAVVTSDPCACGRNYFSRISAYNVEEDHLAVDRDIILQDITALKELAVTFLHPEAAVVQRDAAAFGRNFFSRFSAPMSCDMDIEERELILQDTRGLKQFAAYYHHPEHPTATDPCAFGRNYFNRFGAPEMNGQESLERDMIIEEAIALKKLAVDFLHPEIHVATTDASVFGRNYFTRFSAPENSVEEWRERDLILEDTKALKKLAVDYLHPEAPVATSDPASIGRNFFGRFSASDMDNSETSERDLILEDMKAFKKLAINYLHPEIPVITTDPSSKGRNYFTRFNAPQHPEEDLLERELILNDARALKKLAVDYLHPEVSVVTTDPTSVGRNYFDRASANAHYYMIHTFPAHDDDYEESHHHEHLDHFGMDDELTLYEDVRHELSEMIYRGEQPVKPVIEEEGNLSRSPSSIMLFDLVG